MDIVKVYPSGRVTASRRKKFNQDALVCRYVPSEQQEWDAGQMRAHGIEDAIASRKEHEPLLPLGLSSVPNLSANSQMAHVPTRKRRGSEGISSRSRQQIKDAATLIEKKYGRKHLAFITHTIPTPFVSDIHANWVKIVANLRRRYIRALQKAGLPEDLIMVVEYQEGRLAQTGQAVLHLHIVFKGRFEHSHWQYDKEYWKQHWRKCCEEYITIESNNAQWQAATRVETIKKSCANYLGKYMSKGVSTLVDIIKLDADAFIPSSWHVLSQVLRIWIRRSIRHFEGKRAEALYDYLLFNAKELLRFNRHIKIPTDDGMGRTVGWYGDLRDKSLFCTVDVA